MRHNDAQLGRPAILYKDTQANIEALTAIEGMEAYATDIHLKGFYNGSAWVWSAASTTHYEPVTNGDPDNPEIVFEDGDVVMEEVDN